MNDLEREEKLFAQVNDMLCANLYNIMCNEHFFQTTPSSFHSTFTLPGSDHGKVDGQDVSISTYFQQKSFPLGTLASTDVDIQRVSEGGERMEKGRGKVEVREGVTWRKVYYQLSSCIATVYRGSGDNQSTWCCGYILRSHSCCLHPLSTHSS